LKELDLPKLMLWSTPGAIVTPDVVEWCKENLPNLKIVDIGPGLHFIQEDNPHKIGEEIAKWYDGI
jgi:haloalkane dehalogenase